MQYFWISGDVLQIHPPFFYVACFEVIPSAFSGIRNAFVRPISSTDISQSNCYPVSVLTSSEFCDQRNRPRASIRLLRNRNPSPSHRNALILSHLFPQNRYSTLHPGFLWSSSCTMAQILSMARLMSV